MKKTITTVALLLVLSLLLISEGAVYARADGNGEALSASIETVYGGANGMVSLTFDDGILQTALLVDELCQKYDLYASLMLIVDRIKEDGTGTTKPEDWIEIFEHGHLEPQNHSMSHIGLNDNQPDNLNDETFKREIMDSGDRLEEMFPDFDCLTYATPGSGYNKDAFSYLMTRYYMNRRAGAGSSPQSLDPGFEIGTYGNWSRILAPGAGTSETDQLAYLKGWVDTAAEGYWFCPYIHKVGDVSGTEIPYDTLDAWFAYIDGVRDRGDVWVTTASSATKYIRERQNSTVAATLDGDKITVRVDMADVTQDGLPLAPEVFDHPLTVRVELPDGYEAVGYTINGECRKTLAVKEGKSTYALVDVIPNSGDVSLVELDEDENEHQLKKIKKVPPTCVTLGIDAHLVCTQCDVLFNLDGKPIVGLVSLGLGDHSLVDVPRVEPTESTEGNIAHRICTVCNGKFGFGGELLFVDVSIPKLEPEKPEAPIGAIIGVSVGTLAVATTAVGIYLIKKKKEQNDEAD